MTEVVRSQSRRKLPEQYRRGEHLWVVEQAATISVSVVRICESEVEHDDEVVETDVEEVTEQADVAAVAGEME